MPRFLKRNRITQKRLRELFNYNPETGLFTRRIARGNMPIGVPVYLHKKDGYAHIKISKVSYPAHRLAWIWYYGYDPENCLDHINGIRDDNRICNLREATLRCNNQNAALSSRNTSGFRGVYYQKSAKKWHSKVKVNGEWIYLGLYKTALEAALARHKWEVEHPEIWSCDARKTTVKQILKAIV